MTYSNVQNINELSNVHQSQQIQWLKIQAIKNAQEDALGWRKVAIRERERVGILEIDLRMSESSNRAYKKALTDAQAFIQWVQERHPEVIKDLLENNNAGPQGVPTEREDLSA